MPKRAENTKPFFSIIVPSYNQGGFLGQTIESVVSQKFSNWELLIMDGGSTDDSVKIIKKYAKKYPTKIKWRSYKDEGQVAAINEGLKKARGQVLCYLNSDDYYAPRALNRVASYFSRFKSRSWLVGNCRCSDHTLDLTFKLKELVPYERWPKLLHLSNFINQPAVFIRRSLQEQAGPFNQKYRYAFDYDYWLRCLKLSKPGRLRQCLAVFRVHSQSKGSTDFKKQFTEDLKICQKYSDNQIILGIHRITNWLVIGSYKFLKSSHE